MKSHLSGRTDIPILILSVMAVLIAGVLSIATIAGKSDEIVVSGSMNPDQLATEAVRAGLEAAKWHIECHGRTEKGGLGPRFYVNGATYTAQWGVVNMQDSTVLVKSSGICNVNATENYEVNLESKIKIDFLPTHKNIILSSYYSQNIDGLAEAQPR